MRASIEQGYTTPPASWGLNRNAFLPEKLAYQDVQQQPAPLTIAYARSLQYWAEKLSLPRNLDFCPLAESVKELWETVWEFMTLGHQDITQGLEVESTEPTHPQSGTTIFSWVLSTPFNGQETAKAPSHPMSPFWGGSDMVHLPTPLDWVEQQVYAGCYLFCGPTQPRARWQ